MPPDPNVAAEPRALAARLLALVDRMEADPAAARGTRRRSGLDLPSLADC